MLPYHPEFECLFYYRKCDLMNFFVLMFVLDKFHFLDRQGAGKKKDQCTLNLETGKQTRRCSVPFQQRWECKKQTARLLSNFICIFSTLFFKNQCQRPNISQIRTFSRNSIGLKFRPIIALFRLSGASAFSWGFC